MTARRRTARPTPHRALGLATAAVLALGLTACADGDPGNVADEVASAAQEAADGIAEAGDSVREALAEAQTHADEAAAPLPADESAPA